ncbi:MAG: hypothetical protein IT245_08680 [Bacteroidia bacterium]|nr:hypothetical protein [Bacteroidia bacterium]
MNTSFEKLVESLLHRYECVILPEFGGFIVRESPCNFSASGDRIKPYSKHIFFNPHLTLNDGLIYNEIQTQKGCTYNEAVKWYEDSLNDYKKLISDSGSAKFGPLGTFFPGKENSYWFSPSPEINLSKATYGLFPVEIHKVVKESQSPVIEQEKVLDLVSDVSADRTPIESIEPVKMNYKAWIAAAVVALLVHFVYLKVEKTDVTTNEASVLPTFPTKTELPEATVQSNLIDTSAVVLSEPIITTDSSSLQTIIEPENIQTIQENIPTEIIPENIENPIVDNTPDPTVIVEDTIIEKQYVKVAKYKLENNANYHKIDLEKKGKVVKIEYVNDLYEVYVEQ